MLDGFGCFAVVVGISKIYRSKIFCNVLGAYVLVVEQAKPEPTRKPGIDINGGYSIEFWVLHKVAVFYSAFYIVGFQGKAVGMQLYVYLFAVDSFQGSVHGVFFESFVRFRGFDY